MPGIIRNTHIHFLFFISQKSTLQIQLPIFFHQTWNNSFYLHFDTNLSIFESTSWSTFCLHLVYTQNKEADENMFWSTPRRKSVANHIYINLADRWRGKKGKKKKKGEEKSGSQHVRYQIRSDSGSSVPGQQTRAMQEISNANAPSHFTDGQAVCKPRKPARSR